MRGSGRDALGRIGRHVRLNDEKTKRAYESKSDAYRTFRKMLDRGNPPDDWATLLKQAQAATATLNDDPKAP